MSKQKLANGTLVMVTLLLIGGGMTSYVVEKMQEAPEAETDSGDVRAHESSDSAANGEESACPRELPEDGDWTYLMEALSEEYAQRVLNEAQCARTHGTSFDEQGQGNHLPEHARQNLTYQCHWSDWWNEEGDVCVAKYEMGVRIITSDVTRNVARMCWFDNYSGKELLYYDMDGVRHTAQVTERNPHGYNMSAYRFVRLNITENTSLQWAVANHVDARAMSVTQIHKTVSLFGYEQKNVTSFQNTTYGEGIRILNLQVPVDAHIGACPPIWGSAEKWRAWENNTMAWKEAYEAHHATNTGSTDESDMAREEDSGDAE